MNLAPENPEQEFKFYLKFAKPLILNSSNSAERVRAATWIKKLMDPSETDSFQLKNDYLKLLLFALQRKCLGGPFAKLPKFNAPLPPFPENRNLSQMVKQMIDAETLNVFSPCKGEPCSYMTSVSPDLKEYACAQEIPNFGVHCYYAISANPITTWKNADKAHGMPKLRAQDRSHLNAMSPSSTKTDGGNTTERGERVDVTFDESVRTIEPEGHATGRETLRHGRRARGTASEASRSGADFFQLEDRPDNDKRDEYFENFDPLAGQSEIRSNLASMMRILEELQNHTYMRNTHAGEAIPDFSTQALSSTVKELCGGGFQGSIASTKKYRSKERLDRSDRSIVQGHVIATSDPVDGSIIQLHKAMSIQHQQVPNETDSFHRQSTSPQSLRRKATPGTEGNLVPVDGRFSNYPNLVTSTPLSPPPSSPVQERKSYRQEKPSSGNQLDEGEEQMRRSWLRQQETVNIAMETLMRKSDESQRKRKPRMCTLSSTRGQRSTPVDVPQRTATSPRGNTPQNSQREKSVYGTPEARSTTITRPTLSSLPRDSNVTPLGYPQHGARKGEEIHKARMGADRVPVTMPWCRPLSTNGTQLPWMRFIPQTLHQEDRDQRNDDRIHNMPWFRPVPRDQTYVFKTPRTQEELDSLYKKESEAANVRSGIPRNEPPEYGVSQGRHDGNDHPDNEQARAYGRERAARLQHESDRPSQKPAGPSQKPAGPSQKPAATYKKEGQRQSTSPVTVQSVSSVEASYTQLRATTRYEVENVNTDDESEKSLHEPAGTTAYDSYDADGSHEDGGSEEGMYETSSGSEEECEADYTLANAATVDNLYVTARGWQVANAEESFNAAGTAGYLYQTANTTAWDAYDADDSVDETATEDDLYDTAQGWEVTDADANIDNEVSVSEISYSETAFTTVWEVTNTSDE